ncbi:MAG: DNA alkylation repair protein [Clostridia bacterium]|nr:DNA alkylation repair protein [Clostridia bacterium]
MEQITVTLNTKIDEEYAEFQRRLLPSLSRKAILGVRTPVLRKIAKELSREVCEEFLAELPHEYFEENQLHGFIISDIKDFKNCIEETERFLPHIDNWATCDQFSPKIFKNNKTVLIPYIIKWLSSEHVYTVRFAVGLLMKHFLGDDFQHKYLEYITKIKSDEYYINMEISWYLATALAKQWSATIPYIEEKKLDRWVHNKTIQKAKESNRITLSQKEYLNKLKI